MDFIGYPSIEPWKKFIHFGMGQYDFSPQELYDGNKYNQHCGPKLVPWSCAILSFDKTSSATPNHLWKDGWAPHSHLSNETNPGCGCLGCIGDYTTQLYGDYNKPF